MQRLHQIFRTRKKNLWKGLQLVRKHYQMGVCDPQNVCEYDTWPCAYWREQCDRWTQTNRKTMAIFYRMGNQDGRLLVSKRWVWWPTIIESFSYIRLWHLGDTSEPAWRCKESMIFGGLCGPTRIMHLQHRPSCIHYVIHNRVMYYGLIFARFSLFCYVLRRKKSGHAPVKKVKSSVNATTWRKCWAGELRAIWGESA